jgi:hypothetical protein
MKKICLIIIMSFSVSITAFGQNLGFYGFLPAYSQTGRITKKIDYNIFLSTTINAFNRTIDKVEYPASDLQLYIQPSIIYKMSPNMNFAGSYTYQRSNPLEKFHVNENRLWEQIIYSHILRKGRMTHRIRFEERFIKNNLTKERPLSTRVRYQLGFSTPLEGKTLDPKEFYFNSYNEFYFSLTGNKNATYSENWTYAGIGYNTGKMGKLELGYLLQTSVRDLQQDLRFLNLMQVMWTTNFNFKHKKQ